MTKRRIMMQKVQEYSFAAHDASLFLDTHPGNKKALAYYKKMSALAEQAKVEYERNFGPITKPKGDNEYERWVWAETPFPWNLEG